MIRRVEWQVAVLALVVAVVLVAGLCFDGMVR